VEVLDPRCGGLDLHKTTVVACLVLAVADGRPRQEIRPFGTLTDAVRRLGEWLAEHGVTPVAMEATGGYGKPLFNRLEDRFPLVLANAQHIKGMPGRKTAVKDGEWIADLLRPGLLRASIVPARAPRELRELTRYRTSLIRERAAEANRLQKTREGANIKLGDVATDSLGRSGRAMREAWGAGETDAAPRAQLARGRLRAQVSPLERALAGRGGAHQRFLWPRQLRHRDELMALIDEVSAAIARRLADEPAGPALAPAEQAVPAPATPPAAAADRSEVRTAEPAPTPLVERLLTLPGGAGGPPQGCSPRSARTWRASRRPHSWPRGPPWARVIMSVRGTGPVGARGGAARGCGRPSSKRRKQRAAARGVTGGRSLPASPPDAAPRRRRAQSGIAFSSAPTICSSAAGRIPTPVTPISPSRTGNAPRAGWLSA
jgi:transposase